MQFQSLGEKDLLEEERATHSSVLAWKIPWNEKFLAICAELGFPPQHGEFGADMKVESINDGPVTLILDTDQLMSEPRR